MAQPHQRELQEFLVEYFSREELNEFCLRYFRDVFDDNEGSGIEKNVYARRLVLYCQKREIVPHLLTALQQERPLPFANRLSAYAAPVLPAPPLPPNMPVVRNPRQVFLSHAHEDADFAQRLARDLREAGLSVWMTPDSIAPGEQWVSAIDRGLSESGVFVVALTPSAVRSQWVKKETQWAVQAEQSNRVRLFPLLVQTCDATQLSNLLTLAQFVNFERSYERGLDELYRALGVQSAAMRAAEQQRLRETTQREATETEQLRTENERLRREAQERERQRAAAAERERLRLENERLRREAMAQAVRPTPRVQQQPPLVSRRAVLLGLAGLGLAGAGVLGATWLNLRIPNTPAPMPDATREITPVTVPTSAPNATVISADEVAFELAPGIPMFFRRVSAGEFLMGSDKSKDPNARDDELPQHTVLLSEYYIGKHEVTNAQWDVFAKATGRAFDKPSGKAEHPVVNVSWDDAGAFCAWASKQTNQTLSLPTEAQWEKAARGTDGRIYPWGDGYDKSKANTIEAGKGDTTPVGSFSPQGDSPYGVTNMAGNMWEWCQDWYDAKAYLGRDVNRVSNPSGPATGERRVLRGGSWFALRNDARAAVRNYYHSSDRDFDLGFRVVSRSALLA